MPQPMNFAVIGCGVLAQGQHIPNIAKSEKTTLHTCCDLSDDALKVCTEKHGTLRTTKDFNEAISDPEVEAICLATIETVRLSVIEAAARLGKPVYVEKPMAGTLEEMYEIQKVVKDSGIPFCVGHNRRSAPAMIDGHRIFRAHMTDPKPCPWRYVREGDNRPEVEGDGTAAMSVRINDDWYSWKGWVFTRDHPGYGPMLFEMTHFTDLCNWFMAAEPAEVTALETGMFNHGVVIRYASGEIATIMMCAGGTFGYMKELYEMFGNGGAVVVDHMLEVRTAGIEDVEPRVTYPIMNDRFPEIGVEGGMSGWLAKKRVACREAAEKGDPSLMVSLGPDKGHAHAMDRFVDEIRGEGPVVCGVDDAVAATRVSFAAMKSAHEHRAVKLEEV